MRSDHLIFWDFDGTLGYRSDGWTGTLVQLLAEENPSCGITVDDLRPFLQEGFPWHTPDVGYEKPHLEIFRLALTAAGNPASAWMVGDNVVADVLGAERAGMRGILVRREDLRARWCCPNLENALHVITESDVKG